MVELGSLGFHRAIIRGCYYGPSTPNETRCRTGMTTVTVFDRCSSEETTSGGRFLQGRWTKFDARFSRCYGLLQVVARRILGSSKDAQDVVENCRIRASQSSLEFEQEG